MRPLAPISPFVHFEPSEVEGSIPRRFEAQVASWPDHPAVRADKTTVSYRELNERSNRVAHSLLGRYGDAPEAVALLLPQDVDLVAAIMGVLKAGKYYLGLDPGFPTSLLQSTVAEAGARVVLTTSSQAGVAKEVAPAGVAVLVIDGPSESGGYAVNPGLEVSPDHLAYLFFTSGSTGRPKGVMDNHRNVLHNVMRYTNTLRIGPADRMTLLQSASFSGSVSSLFGALLNAACSLPLNLHANSPAQIARWLAEERITIYHSVPAIFRSVLTECGALPDLRIVRLEGDQASNADLRLFASRAGPDAMLVNGLGTTETGLVRQFFFSPPDEVSGSVVPVGYPVQDMEVLLVDDQHRPVPMGEVGEIAVRSRYLAVGYWQNPDLTHERFLTDPNHPAFRTYLTGDLGRMRPDGCLEHLGRTGRRTKIHGHSVELAEIELALLDLNEVAEAAVVQLDSVVTGPRLVAYYVPLHPPGPTVTELRKALHARLPAFKVPAHFIELPALPLTKNGKLDRGMLPAVGRERPGLSTPFVRPRTLLEDLIAGIWEELLSVSPVGLHDDFLELGGDSLAAMIMLSRVDSALGEEIPPEWLLTTATVEGIAARILDERPHPALPVVRVQKGWEEPPVFYLHGDYESGGYYCKRLAREMGDHVRFFAIPPSGMNGQAVASSYETMAEQHLPAVRGVQPKGPYHLGGTCNGGLVAYEMARRLAAEGEEVAVLAMFVASAQNLRLGALRRVSNRVSGLLGLSPDRRRSLLRGLLRVEYGLRVRGPLGFLGNAMLKALRLPLDLVRGPAVPTTSPSPASGLGDHYRSIDLEYVPGPYPGKITLLWPNDELETAEEAASWWRRLSPEVELRKIPTGHRACLTRDVSLLAGELASCLAESNGRKRP